MAKEDPFSDIGTIDLKDVDQRKAAAMNFFQARGYKPFQAAAIVGNLMHESAGTMDPKVKGDGGASVGIAQWNAERRAGLKKYAALNKMSPDNFMTQLQYVDHELSGDESQAADALKQTGNLQEATQVFSKTYERPGKPMMQARVGHAADALTGQGDPFADIGKAGAKGPAATQQVQPGAMVQGQQQQPELTTGQKVAQKVAPYVRPVLEFGGLTLGGALATPETMGLGTAVGAGLGYAAGKRAADTLEAYAGKKTGQNLKETAIETGKDVATGSAYFLTGEALGALTGSVAKWAGQKVSPWLYDSALKIPPVSVPANVREKVVQKGLEGKYLPNKATLERLQQESQTLAQKVGNLIDRGAKQGKTVDTEAVLSRVDELAKFYENLPDPRPYLEQLQASKQAILEYRGKNIPVDVAQDIKKNLYVNLRKSYGEMSTISKEFDKSVARGIKEELEQQFPELKRLNQELSDKINLEEILTRSVNRIRNYDVIRLGDVVAAGAGAAAEGPQGLGVAFLAKRVLEAPTVKARLAYALRQASKATASEVTKSTTRAVPYAVSPASRKQESEGN